MNQLIKATRIYVAHLPHAEAMREHLANETFNEPLATELSRCGFVPMEQGTLVTDFPGGYAFRFRLAQKVIPGSVVKKAVADACAEIEATSGRKPGKKEKADIKAQVITEMAAQAFVKTTDVVAYFSAASNRLFVPALSQALTDKLMSKLVAAVETVKTETIHVSEVTQGLTARLTKWLERGDDDAFGSFYPVNEVDLEQEERSVKVKMTGLQQASRAIQASLNQGFAVRAIGLSLDGDEFKLTSDFKLRSINFADPDPNHDGEVDGEPGFEAQAAIEVDRLDLIVDNLVEMFQSQKDVQVS